MWKVSLNGMTTRKISVNILILGQKCYPSQTDFTNECKNVYDGVVNGGRCFYLTKQRPTYPIATWDGAWPLCASQNGTMAQIHTSNEHAAIKAYLKVSVSALRDPVMSGRAREMQQTKTVAHPRFFAVSILYPCYYSRAFLELARKFQ